MKYSTENIQNLFWLLIGGQGYNLTVKDFIEGCEDEESAKEEAEDKIKKGFIWFGADCYWHDEYDIDDIKKMENAINKFGDNIEKIEKYFLEEV